MWALAQGVRGDLLLLLLLSANLAAVGRDSAGCFGRYHGPCDQILRWNKRWAGSSSIGSSLIVGSRTTPNPNSQKM